MTRDRCFLAVVRRAPFNRLLVCEKQRKLETGMTTPLPSKLVFLSQLCSLPSDSKVRFLGWCVDSSPSIHACFAMEEPQEDKLTVLQA